MNVVVLLAGGKGTRMQANCPKQHLMVNNRQIIEYTILSFSNSLHIDAILIVSNQEYLETCENFVQKYNKLKWVIAGGETRILSVYNAIRFLESICSKEDKILIHDAARPCIKTTEIEATLDCLDDYDAVTTGVEVYETILQTSNGQLNTIIPREGIFRQTSPEGYRYKILSNLYLSVPYETVEGYNNIGIDQLFCQNKAIGLIKTSALNFKITTPEDISLFETVLKNNFETFIKS